MVGKRRCETLDKKMDGEWIEESWREHQTSMHRLGKDRGGGKGSSSLVAALVSSVMQVPGAFLRTAKRRC